MLLGIPGDNTYSNYKEANLAFWRETVLMLVARFCRGLTKFVCRRWGEDLRIWFDEDRISALQIDRDAVWSRVEASTSITKDEKREAMGYGPYEPPEDGNEAKMLFQPAGELPLGIAGPDAEIVTVTTPQTPPAAEPQDANSPEQPPANASEADNQEEEAA
jgi:hypothetical protein